MCPLISSPNRGFPDWQRVNNYDTGILFSFANQTLPPNQSTGVLDVSRFAYTVISDQITAGDIQVSAQFYFDSAANFPAGTRVWRETINIPITFVRLFNMAPFVRVTWSHPFVGTATASAQLIASNRVYPLEYIMSDPLIVDRQSINVNAGLTDTDYLLDSFAGPAQVFFSVPGASWKVETQALSSADTWETIDRISPAGAGDTTVTRTIPFDATRMVVTNGSGANGAYSLVVVPAITGAA